MLGLFAGALLLRIVHLVTILDSPYFTHLSLDPLAYDEWGMKIASGDWLGSSVFYQDPLYPYFLGLIYRAFGHRHVVVVAIQVALGSLVPLLTFAASRPWLGRPAALAAALIAATYAPSIYYDGLVLKTWMEPLFMAAALLGLSRAVSSGSPRAWGLTGVLLGFGCLVRANFLLLLPLLGSWLLIDPSATCLPTGGPAGRGPRSRWKAIVVLIAGAGLVLGVTALRNRAAGGEWVLTTSQGGQNFFLGNNPLNTTGEYEPLPFVDANPKHEERDFALEAERRMGRKMRPSQISRFWFSEAFTWIRSHRADWLRLVVRKFRLYWGAYEVPDNLDYYEYAKTAPVLRLPLPGFGLVAPLGLVGGFCLLRRQGWSRAVLLCLLAYSASVVLFFVFARYRMAMMPLLFPLAGFTLIDLGRRIHAGGPAPVARLVSGLILALAFVNIPVRAPVDSWSYRLATALGLPARAASTATAHFNLGVTYAQEAQASEHPDELLRLAESELREGLRQEIRYPKMYVELGKVLARMGRNREAIEAYRGALALEPNQWRTHHGLGLLYRRVGDAARAEESFRKAIELAPTQPDCAVELGQVLLQANRRAEAAKAFRRALDLSPANQAARKGLEAASGRTP